METEAKVNEFKAKVKGKWKEVKMKCSDALWNAGAWISSHRDDLIWMVPLGTAAIRGTTKVASAMIKNHAVNKEIRYRERQIYDRSLGRYVTLKRPLTDAEALLIETRRRNGEGLTNILYSMNLLK